MRKSNLSRRTVLAMIATVLGLTAISVAAFGGSGPSSGSGPGQSRTSAIEPVAPIDPDAKDTGKPDKKSTMDPSDPFATSFGAKAKHKVTVRVTADGAANIAVYYRDRKKPKLLTPGSEETRTITARYPLAAVSLQLPGEAPGVATIATCTIVIDDVEVSRVSTRKPWVVKGCIG